MNRPAPRSPYPSNGGGSRLRLETRGIGNGTAVAGPEPMLRFNLLTTDGNALRVQEALVGLVPQNAFDTRFIGEA